VIFSFVVLLSISSHTFPLPSPNTIQNDPVLCKPVKGGLKAVKSVKKSQMQLLGVSGVGKSTMIDTSVRDALVSPSKYTDMNAEIKASLGDGRWKHGVTALKLVPGDTSSGHIIDILWLVTCVMYEAHSRSSARIRSRGKC